MYSLPQPLLPSSTNTRMGHLITLATYVTCISVRLSLIFVPAGNASSLQESTLYLTIRSSLNQWALDFQVRHSSHSAQSTLILRDRETTNESLKVSPLPSAEAQPSEWAPSWKSREHHVLLCQLCTHPTQRLWMLRSLSGRCAS